MTDLDKAQKIALHLGIAGDRESDEHEIHRGMGSKGIICDTWKFSTFEFWLTEYTSQNYDSMCRIGIYSPNGTMVPFESPYLDFGGIYQQFPKHNVDISLDIPTQELDLLLEMINSQ
jgi:hypothetical protein